jgi:DNA-binding transcriptional MerR regulator
MKDDLGETERSDGACRTIGEVADSLDLPAHVLRFWETRFKEIDPIKRAGGRRFYRPEDIELVKAIRHLLYGEGYTIKGVQRILKEQGARQVTQAALSRARQWPGAAAAAEPRLTREAAETAKEPEEAQPQDAHGQRQEGLAEEDRRLLRSALADLTEARRLLSLLRE